MTKRLWAIPVLAALLVVALGGIGFAMPSLGGPTGIVALPNALTAPTDTVQVAASDQQERVSARLARDSSDPIGPVQDVTLWSVQGIGGVSDRTELWGSYASLGSPFEAKIWSLGGKFAVMREPQDRVSVAVGAGYRSASDLFSARILTSASIYSTPVFATLPVDSTVTSFYAVATKDFTERLGESKRRMGNQYRVLGSGGLMYLKLDPDTGGGQSLFRPFFGVEIVGETGSLGLEYRFKDNDMDEKGVLSAVLRYRFSSDLSAELGTTNSDPIGLGLGGQNLFIRLGLNIPLEAFVE